VIIRAGRRAITPKCRSIYEAALRATFTPE
jgi:hypothetical protein